jgi:hypothetical protein
MTINIYMYKEYHMKSFTNFSELWCILRPTYYNCKKKKLYTKQKNARKKKKNIDEGTKKHNYLKHDNWFRPRTRKTNQTETKLSRSRPSSTYLPPSWI